MCQLTHPKLRWLLQLTAALIFFPILHILRICPSVFFLSELITKLRVRRFGSNVGVMEAVDEFFEDQIESSIFKG
jgi:hypothetical protein